MLFYFTTNLGVTMTLAIIAVFAVYFIGKSAIAFHHGNRLDGMWAVSIVVLAIGVLLHIVAMDAVISETRYLVGQAEMFGDEIVANSYQMSEFVPALLLSMPYGFGITVFLGTSYFKRRQRIAVEKNRAIKSAQSRNDVHR